MIYILSGEDTVSSRNKLNELISEDKNVIHLDGKKTSVAALDLELAANDLFGVKKTVVVEHFGKFKPPEKLIELVSKGEKDQNMTVILWDETNVSVKILNSFKSPARNASQHEAGGAKIFSFTFPKVYFAFLDGLTPANSAKSLSALPEVLKTYSAEQILYSIIKRVRQLLLIKLGVHQDSVEFKNMQEWQITKLRNQADKWNEQQLKSAFVSYVELDEMIKTSGLSMDLSAHLDIILMSALN